MKTTPKTWWLTGLPAAGKTTLATRLCKELRQRSLPACLLDGDEVRQGLSKDLGFSMNDREENMRRVAEMARLLNNSGIHAVIALVSPSIAGRSAAKQIIGADSFIEIYVATPLEICRERDPKNLYIKALASKGMEMTGVDSPYEPPINPKFTVLGIGDEEINAITKEFLSHND